MQRYARTRGIIPVFLLGVLLLLVADDVQPASSANLSPQSRVYRVKIVLVGLDPFSIEVPVGARVTFTNNDRNFAHHMTSACEELDAVGQLEPGESGTTSVFQESKTCEYSDRLNPGNPLRHGKIVVR